MFTGIVEALGRVSQVRSLPGDAVALIVEVPEHFTADGTLGESVAINGCCLTVVEMDGRCWTFQAGTETLSKTNLGDLRPDAAVNLERALPANGRLGGHFVQGHVDGVGTVADIVTHADWADYRFQTPAAIAEQLVPKGSVAVDGVSLTVVEVFADGFSVALIPHTLQVTTLGRRNVGDRVNLETDILGKYVRQFLGLLPPADANTDRVQDTN